MPALALNGASRKAILIGSRAGTRFASTQSIIQGGAASSISAVSIAPVETRPR